MNETEIAKTLADENDEFKKLGEEHRTLKQLLTELNERVYLTPDEEMEKKRIQKLKLFKKDKMAQMLNQYKEQQGLS